MPSTETKLRPSFLFTEWTKKEHEILKTMYKKGHTLEEIANRIGRSKKSIRGKVRSHNLQRSQTGEIKIAYPSRSPELHAAIVKLQRKNHVVYSANVIGGTAGKYIYDGKEVPPSFLIEKAKFYD